MINRTSNPIVRVVVVALVALAACTSETSSETSRASSATSGPTVSGEPVRIGLISQEEELYAYPEISVGARAGEAYVNGALGGVDGSPIEVDVCTAGDTPESAVSCAQRFANDDSIKLVIAGTLNTLAASPILVDAGKPVLPIANDLYDQTTEGIFSFDPGVNGLLIGVAAYAAEDLGASTYSLVVPDDPYYTKVVAELMVTLGETYGLQPAGETIVLDPTSDPTGGMTTAREQDADVLAAMIEGPMCAPIANSMQTLGMTMPVITLDVCFGDAVSSGLLDGWHAVAGDTAGVDPSSSGVDPSYNEIVTNYGDDDPLLRTSLGGWAVGNVIVAADVITKAGGADATPAQIADVLSGSYSIALPAFPETSCPGPSPWIGACLRTVSILGFEDGTVNFTKFLSFDMNSMDFLLEE
jgi:branched-chain amino acid transport system substrate-binding protein